MGDHDIISQYYPIPRLEDIGDFLLIKWVAHAPEYFENSRQNHSLFVETNVEQLWIKGKNEKIHVVYGLFGNNFSD